ncbi:hypothetical protein EV356DRAFT_502892 [Viridothelium virens]|uniref:Alpha/beta hydrolase fold-3 domain-containing protein n=1 Tax=Viridothelium virens TaxID=1048519 RepID=A0A6A6H7Y4_VIRVR|nr:hypothetical protein EV356DRAFT_502892 [Viridothelium virens]
MAISLSYTHPAGSLHTPVSPSNIIFAGDSAGGNLAVALTQTLLSFQRTSSTRRINFHSAAVPLPLPAALTIVSPALDQLLCLPSWYANAANDIFEDELPATLPSFPSCSAWPSTPPREHPYAPARTLLHPLASPCTTPPEKWRGCPPLWIAAGGGERLLDVAKVLARDVKDQSGFVEYVQYDGMPHLWPFVFKGWWQSRNVTGRWGEACVRLSRQSLHHKSTELGDENCMAVVVGVDGRTKSLEWKSFSTPVWKQIVELMETKAAAMKVYEGQKGKGRSSVL